MLYMYILDNNNMNKSVVVFNIIFMELRIPYRLHFYFFIPEIFYGEGESSKRERDSVT